MSKNFGRCEKCGKEMRIMGQCTLSAPASLYGNFTKKNLRDKRVYIMGVNWETMDFICECGFIVPGYGNYVSRLEKENTDLRNKITGGKE